MLYTVYTLFPDLVRPWTQEAILGRAAEAGHLKFNVRNLRDHAQNKWNRVDESPFGGGAGMVIRVDVAARAVAEAKAMAPAPDEIILLSPAGEPFSQTIAEELSEKQHLCMLCGRYEGFDARLEPLVTREISIGDYVLMGGEIAALTVIEATARLIPGVLGDQESHEQDSFSTGLLDYPEYTKPNLFEGQGIPEVLKSGHHGKVAQWRRERALERTFYRRPDLLEKVTLSQTDLDFLARLKTKAET
ncbi:MAG: tRNA (guanosine(37)-N1)-methyltransferase TrmD [Trueperaceae bacterium]|nr:tRNA (guanosine(37)-N1)-methyltransferase TrmD [Trueperaceae bacterium]